LLTDLAVFWHISLWQKDIAIDTAIKENTEINLFYDV
jgi:hypothetical protein